MAQGKIADFNQELMLRIMSDEERLIRDAVRSWIDKRVMPHIEHWAWETVFPRELVKEMAELDLLGAPYSEYGLPGLGAVAYGLINQELERGDSGLRSFASVQGALVMYPIFAFGSEEQRKEWLPKLATGEKIGCFGPTEPDFGSNPGGMLTRAVRDGDEWVLNGSKIFITNASTDISAGVTVLCKTGTRDDGKPELSCILVESGTPGYKARVMHDKMMWRASNTSELFFEDCRVPKENLLGTQGHGFHQMMQTLDGGRLSIGAMGLGGAQGCFDMALRYSNEREQFGRPIANFQANAFKLADMAMEIECARLLLYKACWLRDNDMAFSKEAAMGKLYCSEVMYRCANHAVQIHGGYGLMREYDVERFYRDQKLLDIGEGTSEVQRIVISRHIGARCL